MDSHQPKPGENDDDDAIDTEDTPLLDPITAKDLLNATRQEYADLLNSEESGLGILDDKENKPPLFSSGDTPGTNLHNALDTPDQKDDAYDTTDHGDNVYDTTDQRDDKYNTSVHENDDSLGVSPATDPLHSRHNFKFRMNWNCDVDQDSGVVRYKPDIDGQVGLIVGLSPLSAERSSFEIEILDAGHSDTVTVGFTPGVYKRNRHPGWDTGSVGYHGDDGGLFLGLGYAYSTHQTFQTGDIIRCEAQFGYDGYIHTTRFYVNNKEVIKIPSKLYGTPGTGTDHVYPAVGMKSNGAEICLLPSRVWAGGRQIPKDDICLALQNEEPLTKARALLVQHRAIHCVTWREKALANDVMEWALENSNAQVVPELLKAAGDMKANLVMLEDSRGRSVLYRAAKNERMQILPALLAAAGDNKVEILCQKEKEHEENVLHMAAKLRKLEVIQCLLESIKDLRLYDKFDFLGQLDKSGMSVLHIVCDNGQSDMVRAIFRVLPDQWTCGVFVTGDRDSDGRTALHWACQAGDLDTVKAVMEVSTGMERKLLTEQCSEYDKTPTPLHIIVENNNLDLVSSLVEPPGLKKGVPNEAWWRAILCDLEPSIWHTACEKGRNQIMLKILGFVVEGDDKVDAVMKRSLCQREKAGLTALHRACLVGDSDFVETIAITAKKHNCQPEVFEMRAPASQRRKPKADNSNGSSSNETPGTGIFSQKPKSSNNRTEYLELRDKDKVPAQKYSNPKCADDSMEMRAIDIAIERNLSICGQRIFENINGACIYEPLEDKDIKVCPKGVLCYLDDHYTKAKNRLKFATDPSQNETSENEKNMEAINNGVWMKDYEVMDEQLKEFFPSETGLSFVDYIFQHPYTVVDKAGDILVMNHPIMQIRMKIDWNSYGKYLFYLMLVIYSLMLISYTVYIYTIAKVTTPYINSKNNTSHITYTGNLLTETCRWLTLVLVIMLIISELLQLYRKCRYYFYTLENWVDLTGYTLTLVVIITPLWHGYSGWLYQAGIISMLISWTNLIIILSKIPHFGQNFLMMNKVILKVVSFLPVLCLFVLMFMLAFHKLLQNQDQFKNFGPSLTKTVAIWIGELDYGDMFYDESNDDRFDVLTHILFVVMVVVMCICLMNLLTGVAVSDVGELLKQTELTAFKTRADLLLQYERVLPKKWKERFLQIYFRRHDFKQILDDIEKNYNDRKMGYDDPIDKMQINLQKTIGPIETYINDVISQLDSKHMKRHDRLVSQLQSVQEHGKKVGINVEQLSMKVDANIEHSSQKSEHVEAKVHHLSRNIDPYVEQMSKVIQTLSEKVENNTSIVMELVGQQKVYEQKVDQLSSKVELLTEMVRKMMDKLK